VFGAENYDALTTKTAVHSAKLIKKVDQCRAVYMCAHLFWTGTDGEGRRDERRVFECLQKGLKLADACVDTVAGVQLFVELLDQYLFFFERGNSLVMPKYIKGLVALIDTNMRNFAGGEAAEEEAAIRAHYRNTLLTIEQKKNAPQTSKLFADI